MLYRTLLAGIHKNILGKADIYITRDGSLTILGYTDLFGEGRYDIFLIKTQSADLSFLQ